MIVDLVQLLLGIGLFFIINWIGKHSYSIGYVEISIFAKNEESPALNFLIRVLTPVVYIIIISALFYYLGQDRFVINIYLVNIYYIIFRLIFNIATNRSLLINWYRQGLYWAGIIILSYFAYEKMIKIKANLLPEFDSLSNELWIIILIFLFQLANNINIDNSLSEKRKQNYIRSRYKKFHSLYGSTIKGVTNNQKLEALIYAIMIYEDFNRPKVIRLIENFKQKLTQKPHTLGVMQIRTSKILTDKESVLLGANKIVEAHANFWLSTNTDEEELEESYIFSQIISNYNGGSSYNYEVIDLVQLLLNDFYHGTTDSIQPVIKQLSEVNV